MGRSGRQEVLDQALSCQGVHLFLRTSQRVPVQPGYPPANLKKQYVPPKDMLAEPKK